MARLNYAYLFRTILLVLVSTSTNGSWFTPKAVVFPVIKDPSLQYIIQIKQRTPPVPVKLTVDLGGQFMWVDCDRGYVSSTYKPPHCEGALCLITTKSTGCSRCSSRPPGPGCNSNACKVFPENSIIDLAANGELASDTIFISTTDPSNPIRDVTVRFFLFACGTTYLLEGLATGVTGMAGFGNAVNSFPSQLSLAFLFYTKFAICLPSDTTFPGVIIAAYAGNDPFHFLPNINLTKSLTYTPLLLNPVGTAAVSFDGEESSDYFIGVRSIIINSRSVPLNTTLLEIDSQGVGGTKISTVEPYTVLESSIYEAVLKSFTAELRGVARAAAAVAPFEACFYAKSLSRTRVGPGVPSIDLILHKKDVIWRIFGANSMVRVNDDVLCLGFVDGGVHARTSIVIGAHQIEDNLLHFDLVSTKLGFSSTLLDRMTSCADFNFTSIS